MPGSRQANRAIASLIAMRIVYAINWLNVGAVFYAMGPEFGSGVVGLGTLTSTFYLGLGLFQLPGGVMAAKWGPKKIVVLGTMLSSASALATGIAPTLEVVAVLRLLVGAGMAFVFAPAVVIISGLVRGGGSGVGVGLFNSAYDVGGIFALFLWGIIAATTGWRPSLELGGGLGIVSGLLVMLTAPVDEKKLEFKVRTEQLRKVLEDPRLIIIAVGMLAVSVGNGLISSFMEYYLIGTFGVGTAYAGIIASMVVAIPIFSALYAGRLYDRTRRTKALMLASNVGGIAALAVSAYPSVVTALACTLVGGLISGFGFTVGFAAAKDYHRAEREYDGLAVAWVNCISLTGAVFPPIIFSYVADLNGYPYAWLAGALLTAIFTVPLLFLAEKGGGARAALQLSRRPSLRPQSAQTHLSP
ncbi:MAG: MFS transporter [Nitrososphaerales archaeon]|nr:MFS transporter [Nitrososphaerales archaeon]